MWNPNAEVRATRVPFLRPIRVDPNSPTTPPSRLLASNISRGGIFLRSARPLPVGTELKLSIEASGKVLPFAQGLVVWERSSPSAHPQTGFGVRFTKLDPRAHALLDFLVGNASGNAANSGNAAVPPRMKVRAQIPLDKDPALLSAASDDAENLPFHSPPPVPSRADARETFRRPAEATAAPPAEDEDGPSITVTEPEQNDNGVRQAAPTVRTERSEAESKPSPDSAPVSEQEHRSSADPAVPPGLSKQPNHSTAPAVLHGFSAEPAVPPGLASARQPHKSAAEPAVSPGGASARQPHKSSAEPAGSPGVASVKQPQGSSAEPLLREFPSSKQSHEPAVPPSFTSAEPTREPVRRVARPIDSPNGEPKVAPWNRRPKEDEHGAVTVRYPVEGEPFAKPGRQARLEAQLTASTQNALDPAASGQYSISVAGTLTLPSTTPEPERPRNLLRDVIIPAALVAMCICFIAQVSYWAGARERFAEVLAAAKPAPQAATPPAAPEQAARAPEPAPPAAPPGPNAAPTTPAAAPAETEKTVVAAKASDPEEDDDALDGLPAPGERGYVNVPENGSVRGMSYALGHNETTWHLELRRGAAIRWAYLLPEPPRLVIDTENAPPAASQTVDVPRESDAEHVRFGERDGSTRIVLDLLRAPERVRRVRNRIRLTFPSLPPPSAP